MRKFNAKKWWRNVHELMATQNLTQAGMSAKLGMSPGYFSQMFNVYGSPNVTVALAIAELLNTTVEELAYSNIGLERRKRELENKLRKIQNELNELETEA